MNKRQTTMKGMKEVGGFTLIEMMIVIAIIAILAAIAYPNYLNYMMKSRRADAKTLLMGMAAREEQYFLDNRTYTATLTDLGYASNPAISEKGYYTVAAVLNANGYTLTATPKAGTPQVADVCTTLTLDDKGTKGFTPPTAVNCW